MALLVIVLLLAAVASGTLAWRWWRQERIERLREQARLQVVEGQMATLRAALRISAAEHATRRQMHTEFVQADATANGVGAQDPWCS